MTLVDWSKLSQVNKNENSRLKAHNNIMNDVNFLACSWNVLDLFGLPHEHIKALTFIFHPVWFAAKAQTHEVTYDYQPVVDLSSSFCLNSEVW